MNTVRLPLFLQRGFKVKAVARPRSSKVLEGYGPNIEASGGGDHVESGCCFRAKL